MTAGTHVVGAEGLHTFDSPAGEGPIVVRATADESGGYYDLVEMTVAPGPGVTPMHVHHDNDEAMLVLEGELAVRLGDEDHHLVAGAYAMAPRGVPHTYRNAGDVPARVLVTFTPGDHWRYLEAASELGPVEQESDLERMQPVLESYGIEMVGGPLASASVEEDR